MLTLTAPDAHFQLPAQVSIHATRDLVVDEELYALYGAAYGSHRDYAVGEPGPKLLKANISLQQRPAAMPSAQVCDLQGHQCAVGLSR